MGRRNLVIVAVVVALAASAVCFVACSDCGESSSGSSPDGSASGGGDSGAGANQDVGDETPRVSSKVLLVAQSTFTRNDQGMWSTPDKAKLIILRQRGQEWEEEVIVDEESNVFHKGMVWEEQGQEPAILTIGGNKAVLKLWRRGADGWQATTVWQPTFGGTNNRLRDVELGDVDGDGSQDIVLATHDQGVVAVVRRTEAGLEPTEIDRRENTFVHEIELGDIDGDGRPEIYATPSQPNQGGGGAQPGSIVRYSFADGQFVREVVVELERRHAKEILVADLDGDGRPELYGAIEGETEAGEGGRPRLVAPTEIRRYTRGDGGWTSEVVASITAEMQCRFLVAGDFDGDGSAELIAAAMRTGVWMYDPSDSLPWAGRNMISGGQGIEFEHASLLADIDGNSALELYIAEDGPGKGRVVRHLWSGDNGGSISPAEVLTRRTVPASAITWNMWVDDLPAAP